MISPTALQFSLTHFDKLPEFKALLRAGRWLNKVSYFATVKVVYKLAMKSFLVAVLVDQQKIKYFFTETKCHF